ncbi:MAG: hypothetical protein ABL914_06535 [Novosphingobium sp.]|uniref:hypothetical protein n=1 Tax=Novosphingobium sp. TaxID=1874826 RepID=UPI0032B8C861
MLTADIIALLFQFDRPAVLPVLLLATVAPARRYARATGRAMTMAIAFTVALHFAAWLAYGPARPVHAVCSLVGLALLIPLAVRSQRTYPLIAAAAALLAALVQLVGTLLPPAQADAAGLIAALANAVLVAACWAGLIQDFRRGGKYRRGSQPVAIRI